MHRCLLDILTTRDLQYPALTSALEPIVLVTIAGVAEAFMSVINVITYKTYFKQLNLLDSEGANLTDEDLNTSINKPENM